MRVATRPLQLLLTAASMVGCINAIVGGVAVAHPPLAAGGSGPGGRGDRRGGGAGPGPLCFGYQVRRFRRAAAVPRSCTKSESPSLPGWTNRVRS